MDLLKEWGIPILQNWLADLLWWAIMGGGVGMLAWLIRNTAPWGRMVLAAIAGAAIAVGLGYIVLSTTERRSLDVPSTGSQSQPPSVFSEKETSLLENIFLRLPRPCLVKIRAAPENESFRSAFISAADSSLFRLDNRGSPLIEWCWLVKDDPVDDNPDLYPGALSDMVQGTIVINAAPSNFEVAESLATALKEEVGLRMQVRTGLPPGSRENLLYIQIGAGQLRVK